MEGARRLRVTNRARTKPVRHWTRGEIIALGGTLIGAITCIGVLSTVPPLRDWLRTDEPSTAPNTLTEPAEGSVFNQALEQQRMLLQEQTLAMREEVLRLNTERINARKARISATAERFKDGDERKYDRILLANHCSVPIDVAVHYKDIDETWITRGWWRVDPDATVSTDAMTRNTPIYFYAENLSEKRFWDGTGREDSASFKVSNSRFDHLKGETFVFDNPRDVSFYRRETGKAWIDHTEPFKCPVEAEPGS